MTVHREVLAAFAAGILAAGACAGATFGSGVGDRLLQ
jgi:hypothetical protein